MSANNFMNHGGCGCSSGCGRNDCPALGPFVAVDAACITPPVVRPAGSVIPFSSGTIPAVLTSVAGGLIGTVSLIGFGTSVIGVSVVGNTITLPGLNEAFSVPRAGTITDISASFTETLGLTVIGTAIINARIYRAPQGSNVFTATNATVDLPPLTGAIAIGNTVSASASFAPVPVEVGDRLVMVFSITATGLGTLINVATGAASAGITLN